MPIYLYQHPKTKKIFEALRLIKNRNKSFYAPDGVKCKRVTCNKFSDWRKHREVFELDPAYVKKCRPKYVKFRDGHREKYDPQKHF